MNQTYAICATAFFVTYAIISVLHGNGFTVVFTSASLILAGMGQFWAQGDTPKTYDLSVIFTGMALAAAFMSFCSLVINMA